MPAPLFDILPCGFRGGPPIVLAAHSVLRSSELDA